MQERKAKIEKRGNAERESLQESGPKSACQDLNQGPGGLEAGTLPTHPPHLRSYLAFPQTQYSSS